MKELFRLKIASKRQTTIPQRMLTALRLAEGDEIQLTIDDGHIVAAQPCKAVPTALLSDELLAKLEAREEKLAAGKGMDLQQALNKISTHA